MKDYRQHQEYLALLASVLENPTDDAPRLIIADWIEEHGDDFRAKIIRDVYPIDNGVYSFPDGRLSGIRTYNCRQLDQHLAELPSSHHHWNWPFINRNYRPEVVYLKTESRDFESVRHTLPRNEKHDWVVFRLGFVEELCTTAERFSRYAKNWFRHNPILKVWLRDRRPQDYYPERVFLWSRGPIGLYHANIPDRIAELHTSPLLSAGWPAFRTVDAANLALSDACVRYGRELAGLPDLPKT